MKTKLTILVIAIVIIIGGIIGYNSYKASQYERTRKEFVIQASKAAGVYITLCNDIREVWYRYIFKNEKYYDPTDGMFMNWSTENTIYCSNFSEAIQKRMEWQEAKITPEMREPFYEARRLYKEMTPPPSKFEGTHRYVKQMYKAMDKLKELAENPTGNLQEYTSNCNLCVEEYTSALKDLEIEADL